MLADLGAVHLTLAGSADEKRAGHLRAGHLVAGLACIEEALSAAPYLLEARFNAGLALEALGLRSRARAAWRKYIDLDPASGWTAEARARLRELIMPHEPTTGWDNARGKLVVAAKRGDDALVQATVDRWPQAARLYGEEDVLAAWAAAEARGDTSEAMANLAVARSIGHALASRHAEHMLRATVATIYDARETDRQRLLRLAHGHGLIEQGRRLSEQDLFSSSAEVFREAAAELKGADSPFHRWALTHQAMATYYQPDYSEALKLLATARRGVDRTRYTTLVARNLWLAGLSHYASGHLPEALICYRESLQLFTQAGEIAHAAFVESLTAGALRQLGQHDFAWSHRLRALAKLGEIDDVRRRYSVAKEAADAALAENRPRLALRFLEELLDSFYERVPAGVVAETYGQLAVVNLELGQATAALRSISHGRAYARQIRDPDFRERVKADLSVLYSRMVSTAHPWEALGGLTQALNYYQQAGFLIESARLLHERASVYQMLQLIDEAESDLIVGLNEYERNRERLQDARSRILYFEQAQLLNEALVRLQAEKRHDPARALEFAERARARSLGDELFGDRSLGNVGPHGLTASPPRSIDEFQKGLALDEALIFYEVTAKHLFAWVLRRDNLSSAALELSRDQLSRLVQRFRSVVIEGDDGLDLSRRLYDVLIRPIADHLEGVAVVIFVPDESLFELPFAALMNSDSGHFLIEDFSISKVPSIASFTASTLLARSRRSPLDRVAVLTAGPSRLTLNLPRLIEAEQEAHSVAQLYSEAEEIEGGDQPVEKILKSLSNAAVIHIATHGLASNRESTWSALWLGGAGPEQVLTASDLMGTRFDHTRVVVLAGCGTALGESRAGEGVLSIAQCFLSSHVPAVVASLWDISDHESMSISPKFHQWLLRTKEPAHALRKTQVELLTATHRNGGSLRFWAALELIGR